MSGKTNTCKQRFRVRECTYCDELLVLRPIVGIAGWVSKRSSYNKTGGFVNQALNCEYFVFLCYMKAIYSQKTTQLRN